MIYVPGPGYQLVRLMASNWSLAPIEAVKFRSGRSQPDRSDRRRTDRGWGRDVVCRSGARTDSALRHSTANRARLRCSIRPCHANEQSRPAFCRRSNETGHRSLSPGPHSTDSRILVGTELTQDSRPARAPGVLVSQMDDSKRRSSRLLPRLKLQDSRRLLWHR